jgi:hypothetical protein
MGMARTPNKTERYIVILKNKCRIIIAKIIEMGRRFKQIRPTKRRGQMALL